MEVLELLASCMSCLCQENCINKPLAKQCSYLKHPRREVEKLIKKMEELGARASDVKQRLDLAKVQRGMEPTAEVKLWLQNVQKFQNTMDNMVDDITREKRCLYGCFPNYIYRSKSGKCVEEKIKEVIELLEEGKFSDESLVDLVPERGMELPTTKIVGNTTAKRSLEKICEFLMDEEVGRIGVYGMGGVGKTTIMTEINNRLLKEIGRFDNVLWVTASKESNLEKLQKDIGKIIDLHFNEYDSEMERAAKLLDALRRKRRFVLIIDDLWQPFSLEKIGIPDPTRENGCKLLITTRTLRVCQGMETVKEVEIHMLSEEEAWDLFKEKVGEDVLVYPSVQAIARDVAKECGGLPLAIITVGRALRKVNDVMEWQNALTEMRDSMATLDGMEEQVFARLRFSYERLRDNITRSCFCFCALYPEDHHIETRELIENWMWEGLLGEVGTVQAYMQKGKVILNELKNACMLESVGQEGNRDEHVKMHDLVRDMAIALTRGSPRCIIQAGLGLHSPPDEDKWHGELERVSLMRNDLKYLLGEPNCPQLLTLLLQYNSISKSISSSFFYHMPKLKLLDLSYTGIDCLPESLSDLQNLRALKLCSCWNLIKVPSLAKLKELRILDLSYTSIWELPEGMEMLIKLRCLDLSNTHVNEFPAGLLPIYKVLEKLLIARSLNKSALGYDKETYVEELVSKTSLSVLEVNFCSLQDFDKYVTSGHWNQLESFKLYVGYLQSDLHPGKNSVVFCKDNFLEAGRPVVLPDKTVEFVISNCSDITQLSMCLGTPMRLNICKVESCHRLEWILMDGDKNLCNIERLEIHYLVKLRGICKGIAPPEAFTSLKVLQVSNCNNLKSLLSPKLLQDLKNLEEIEIEYCSIMEVLAIGEELDEISAENSTLITLPSLQRLRLKSLPKLERIFKGVMICDSLHTIEVLECSRLKSLPLSTEIGLSPPSALKQIKGSREWWDSLHWSNSKTSSILHPLFKEETMQQ